MDHDIRRAPHMTGRRWTAAAAIAVAAVAGFIWTTAASGAQPPLVLTAPATTVIDTPEGPATVSVRPADQLPASGAQITVRGDGFQPSDDLWIAVCQDDGVAPAAFIHCLGGPIPDLNSSSSWAIVTSDDSVPYAGPVVTTWRKNGSFKVTLQVMVAAGADADCLAGSCSVYLRSADDGDRTLDAAIPVTFRAPTTGTVAPTTTAELKTETIGGAPTTVAPDSLALPSVPAGQEQTVTFSGFTPRERIDVTLYSDPIELPTEQADGTGLVTIDFVVPDDIDLGQHLIQAVGRKSGVVGIAQFAVTEAEAPESDATTEAPTSDTEAVSTDEVFPPSAVDEVTPLGTAPETVLDLAPTDDAADLAQGETGATADEGAAEGSGGVNRTLWLLITLLAVVLIGGAAGIVVMVRRRRDDEADLPTVTAYPAERYDVQEPAQPTWHSPAPTAAQPPAPPDPIWQQATVQQPTVQQPPEPQGQPPVPPVDPQMPNPDHWTGLFGDSGARRDPDEPGRHHRPE